MTGVHDQHLTSPFPGTFSESCRAGHLCAIMKCAVRKTKMQERGVVLLITFRSDLSDGDAWANDVLHLIYAVLWARGVA